MDDVRQRRRIVSHDTSEVVKEDIKEADEAKRQLEKPSKEETLWDVCLEVFLPFVVAGLGMATTGITLNHVKVTAVIPFCSYIISASI